jgi:hypothetical protein
VRITALLGRDDDAIRETNNAAHRFLVAGRQFRGDRFRFGNSASLANYFLSHDARRFDLRF